MPDVRIARPKSLAELTLQWDQLAVERDRQLTSGIDVSFKHIVVPAAMRLLEGANLSLLLDIGAGTGHFTSIASSLATSIVGIEPSGASIAIAERVCAEKKNVRFIHAAVENASLAGCGEQGSAAVALMVMMTTPDLAKFASSLRTLLVPDAAFVAVIPHPCFWPTYWKYADAPWFDYSKEIFIEASFSISNDQTDVRTTHIHRPLSQYISTFSAHGFRLDAVQEPMPEAAIESMYPVPWRFPRFIALRWIKM